MIIKFFFIHLIFYQSLIYGHNRFSNLYSISSGTNVISLSYPKDDDSLGFENYRSLGLSTLLEISSLYKLSSVFVESRFSFNLNTPVYMEDIFYMSYFRYSNSGLV